MVKLILSIIFVIILGCQSNNQKVTDENGIFSSEDYVVLTASSGDSKSERINIPTVQCGMCDMNIAEGLENLAGLEKFAISIDNKLVEVIFNPVTLNISQIEQAISMTGYQANNTKADPGIYKNLAGCCKLPEDRG